MSASPPPATQAAAQQRPQRPSGGPRPARGGNHSGSGAHSARAAPAASASGKLLPTGVSPQSSLRDIERLHGRALRSDESKQVQLVRDLKPNWDSAKVLDFCKEHEFNDSKVSHALSSEFECTMHTRMRTQRLCMDATPTVQVAPC
jgi:hypothetical protein